MKIDEESDFLLYRQMVEKSIHVPNTDLVKFGKGVYVGPFSSIIASVSSIYIGDNVFIGPSVVIANADHYMGADFSKTKDVDKENTKDIVIGKDCWIGSNSVILKGVNLGEGCVVGAGSVVTKSFPRGSIIFGNPAKLYKKRK